jgi:hypothetical protein
MAENDEGPGGTDRPDVPPESAAGTGAPVEPTPTTTRPVIPPEAAATPAGAPAAGPVLKTRWRDRAWSFRAMIAVALASVLVGGVAGGVIVAASGDDHERDQYRMGPWGPGGQMPPGWRGPRHFKDGGPRWHWDDDDMMPGQPLTPYGQPSPTTPSPSSGSSPGSTG